MAKFFWDLKHGRSHSEKTSQPERLCLIEDALIRQNMFLKRKKAGDEYNFLLFAEHDKVYVYTEADAQKIRRLGDKAGLFRPNMPPFPAPDYVLSENRGGSITYHGPGQIVCYMVICLQDLGVNGPHHLASLIDESIKEFLANLNITGYTTDELCQIESKELINKLTSQKLMTLDSGGQRKMKETTGGVWVVSPRNSEARKIASRGFKVAIHHYPDDPNNTVVQFTKYGFAINLSTDLRYFDYIYPCGEDIEMTSVGQLTGKNYPIYKAAEDLAKIIIEKLTKTATEAKNKKAS